jgi:hypothetical protein
MATTTNYAWETPDDTDLVKDGAAAIRTLGSSVDTTTKALNPSTTLGDIEYRSSTANTNTRLAIGSTGNVLTVAGGVPTWAAPAGGGKVLQVVSAEYSTETDNSTTTYADTGLTATITPTLSTSKILCMVSITMGKSSDNANNAANVQILRGATSILENKQLFYTGTAIWNISQWATNILDSPATTSATTYKVQFKQWFNNGARVRANNDGSKSTIVLIEIGA